MMRTLFLLMALSACAAGPDRPAPAPQAEESTVLERTGNFMGEFFGRVLLPALLSVHP